MKDKHIADLSAEQVKELDDLSFQKKAAEDAFEVAFNFYMNKVANYNKRWKAFWEELEHCYKIDTSKCDYKVKTVKGCTSLYRKGETGEEK